jgi:hypothetical protein
MLSSGNLPHRLPHPVLSLFSCRQPLFLPCGVALLLSLPILTMPALAQKETWSLQRGSSVGPETKVKPTNCVTGPDGAVTCDTKLENPKGVTPAKPSYNPFPN